MHPARGQLRMPRPRSSRLVGQVQAVAASTARRALQKPLLPGPRTHRGEVREDGALQLRPPPVPRPPLPEAVGGEI